MKKLKYKHQHQRSQTRSECYWGWREGGPPARYTFPSSRLRNRQSSPRQTRRTRCIVVTSPTTSGTRCCFALKFVVRPLCIVHPQAPRVKGNAKSLNFNVCRTPRLCHFSPIVPCHATTVGVLKSPTKELLGEDISTFTYLMYLCC